MTKIIQRHDTAANWASANPVLAQGEIGIEDDTRKFKFGDGTTAWADLPYASSEGGGGASYVFTGGLTESNGVVSVNGANLKTDFSNFVNINGNPTINTDYSVTGFSDTNYVTCKSLIDGTEDNWEIVIPLEVNSLSEAGILDTDIGTQQFRFTLNSDGTLRFRINSDLYSNTYQFDIASTETISAGEKVYTKITYSSTTGYSIYKSTDGLEFTQIASTSDATKVLYNNDCYWVFGDNSATGASLDGTIYFKEVYVKRNNDNKIYLAGNVIGLTKYEELPDKPTINGFKVSGNINPSKVNIQPLLTPKAGVEIKQDGDWRILNGSYDEATKVITFNKYDLRNSTTAGVFKYLLGANGIGYYVNSTTLKPIVGLITPFYKNVTLKLNNYVYDAIILGNYDSVNFTPKVWISLEDSAASANILKITSVISGQLQNFGTTTISTTLTSTSTTVPSSRAAYFPYLTMLYENNIYIFKSGWGNSSSTGTSRYVKTQTTQDSIFNECTHMWFIPKVQTMGLGQNVELMSGDKSLALTRRELTKEEQNASLMSPDDTDKEYYTSISVKTDGVTTKINDSGQLEAIAQDAPIATTTTVGAVKPDGTTITVGEDGTISSVAPANMITTENIASDATITSMNSTIETAQSDITTLNANVATLQNQSTYPKILLGSGKILDANGDTTEGHGTFTVTLYQNGECRVDFMCKITTAGTASDNFNWGLSVDLLKGINNNIPTITPKKGGALVFFDSSGTVNSNSNGFGGTASPAAVATKWMFGRIYTLEGTWGGWNSTKFPVDSYIYGFTIGTFNIDEV